jgi:hypothetical protein
MSIFKDKQLTLTKDGNNNYQIKFEGAPPAEGTLAALLEKLEKEHCNGGKITSLVIPSSVTSIGILAFGDCKNLTSIVIPSSVTSIGAGAFCGCSNLTSITIPNSVTSIGRYAFDGCSGLTSIDIPSSVISIGAGAFCGCSNLTSITIPNSVTSIGILAFDGCSGLTSIVIPSSVTSIGDGAFHNCNNLTSITIPNSVTSIGKYTFCGCSGLTSIVIPSSVESIGDGAFTGCSPELILHVNTDDSLVTEKTLEQIVEDFKQKHPHIIDCKVELFSPVYITIDIKPNSNEENTVMVKGYALDGTEEFNITTLGKDHTLSDLKKAIETQEGIHSWNIIALSDPEGTITDKNYQGIKQSKNVDGAASDAAAGPSNNSGAGAGAGANFSTTPLKTANDHDNDYNATSFSDIKISQLVPKKLT